MASRTILRLLRFMVLVSCGTISRVGAQAPVLTGENCGIFEPSAFLIGILCTDACGPGTEYLLSFQLPEYLQGCLLTCSDGTEYRGEECFGDNACALCTGGDNPSTAPPAASPNPGTPTEPTPGTSPEPPASSPSDDGCYGKGKGSYYDDDYSGKGGKGKRKLGTMMGKGMKCLTKVPKEPKTPKAGSEASGKGMKRVLK